jgi:hypothetical protein
MPYAGNNKASPPAANGPPGSAATGRSGFFHHHHDATAANSQGNSTLTNTTNNKASTAGQTAVVQTTFSNHHYVWRVNESLGSGSSTTTATSTSSTAIKTDGSSSNGNGAFQTTNLNLAATSHTLTVGGLVGNQSVTITVGGKPLSVTGSTLLTPAEVAAVYQVLRSGQQSIVLDSRGSADGGTLIIGQRLSQYVGNLVIPQGVSVTDISKSDKVDIMGSFSDAGSFYIVSKNPTLTDLSLVANNIYVQSTGLISDVLPAGSLLKTAGLVPNF